jgi:hypothetical protein
MQSLTKSGYTREQVLIALQGAYGTRELDFRYELLDETNTTIRTLNTVTTCNINYSSESPIKRTGRIQLVEEGNLSSDITEINYLKHRIKPFIRVKIPPIPVAGGLHSAGSYEEAIGLVDNIIARWKLDDAFDSVVGHNEIGSHDLVHGTVAHPGRLGIIEDDGRSLYLALNPNSYTTADNAGDYLNSLYAFSFGGWFQSETVGEDKLLISTAPVGTYADLLSSTHNDLAAFTWDDIESFGLYTPGSASSSTWNEIEASNFTYAELQTHDHPLAEVITGLTVSFNGVSRNIEVKFSVNNTKISAVTPVNTQTTNTTFFAFTWTSGGALALYINGLKVTEIASNVIGPLQNIGDLIFGETFQGTIDDWFFSSSVMSEVTIATLYATGAGVGTGTFEGDKFVEWEQGVFLLSSPSRNIDESGVVVRDVEIYDQAVILDSDVAEETYYVSAGVVYTDAVKEILDANPSIPKYEMSVSVATLPVQMVWDAGTSKLKILNDLLSAINYEQLYFDESGTAQVQPHIDPRLRTPEYVYNTGSVSVLTAQASQSLDLFKQPNRWVLIVSDPDRTVLKSVVTNNDPDSPTSTVSRGRTITAFAAEQDAVDQFTLDQKAAKLAQEASQVYEEVEFSTAVIPTHSHRDIYTLIYPALGIQGDYVEVGWSYNLVAGDIMKHTARRVIQLGGV